MRNIALGAVALAALVIAYHYAWTVPKLAKASAAYAHTRQCDEDGRAFVVRQQSDNPNTFWTSSEYHYSEHLNTCLAEYGAAFYNSDFSKATSVRWIYDVYSNKLLLSGCSGDNVSVCKLQGMANPDVMTKTIEEYKQAKIALFGGS